MQFISLYVKLHPQQIVSSALDDGLLRDRLVGHSCITSLWKIYWQPEAVWSEL